VTRFLRVAALVLTIAAAAPAAAAPAGESQTASVRVYFLQGEQLVAVTRTGSTVKPAVTALLAILAAERAAAPYRYGVLAGVLRTDERYGVILQKGSPLTRRVNAAVRALVANGTLSRLQRRWLLTDLASLRTLG
jgi:hypothetical protein